MGEVVVVVVAANRTDGELVWRRHHSDDAAITASVSFCDSNKRRRCGLSPSTVERFEIARCARLQSINAAM
jgi:hypothetical protein